jgi:4'-phosphopantetheinyl transferase
MSNPLIFQWPDIPAPPPAGRPVLVRVITSPARQLARQELRAVLRHVLAAWSGHSTEQLPLCETTHGPVWMEQPGELPLDLSLSYAEGEGWIGLIREGWIGVDSMRIQYFPEAELVAKHYFDSEALSTFHQSTDPALAFARAWTALEARLKCLKLPLCESSVARASNIKECTVQNLIQSGNLMVTVASRSKPVWNGPEGPNLN